MLREAFATLQDYWRVRLEVVLTPEQLRLYDAYCTRLQLGPVIPTSEEQQVLDIVTADRLVAAREWELERMVRGMPH